MNGFKVLGQANNGEEAVSLFKSLSEKPDIILMDHRMPIKNGIDATKEILSLDSNAKILFASADDSVKGEALSIGAIGFTTKPFSITELIEDMEKFVNVTWDIFGAFRINDTYINTYPITGVGWIWGGKKASSIRSNERDPDNCDNLVYIVDDREKILTAGCTAYIEKLIDPESFTGELNKYL